GVLGISCGIISGQDEPPKSPPAKAGEKGEKKAEEEQEWTGSVDDEALAEDAPIVVSNPAEWKALWEKWKFAEKLPELDFSKKVAVVQTTRASKIKLQISLEKETGVLSVRSMSTRDLRPGFRYVIATFPREGIKSVEASE
ncbi:MAG: hypothetical protein HKN23_13680, partial [Verrucomicrobiales bacterium]|nr:hypothetical protein [Verrucomicrobiales bacterium]